MGELRDFTYRGRVVGKVNAPATQSDAIYIFTTPKRYVSPCELDLLIKCLLDGFDYNIGTVGEIYLRIPKKTKYGPLLNGIARAYWELQTGRKEFSEGQQQLEREADSS